MSHDVGVRELRQHLSVYLARVRRGETLTVTERRQVVAVLAPATRAEDAVGRLVAAGRALPAKRPVAARPKPLRSSGPALSRLVRDLGEDAIFVPYAYLDASAIAKLVVLEPETTALEHDLVHRRGLLSSRLAATELRRAARRAGRRRILQQVDDVLEALVLVDLSADILDRAGRLAPPELRTLDAIHLATATSLGIRDLEFITYDARLASAARAAGLVVVRPA